MTQIEAYELGRGNALEAIDQADSFGGLEVALDDYLCNLGDGLAENGALEFGADANRGFEAVLIERSITYRPMGL